MADREETHLEECIRRSGPLPDVSDLSSEDLAAALEEMTERVCPWGEPGSNPDYLNKTEAAALLEAARRLRAAAERLGE